jgi:hypothetical protein
MQTKQERKKKTKKEHKLIIRDLKAAKDPKAGVLIKEQFALKL